MGCSCSGGGAQIRVPDQPVSDQGTMSFVLMQPDGTQETYGSRLEADAANARQGFSGVVRVISI